MSWTAMLVASIVGLVGSSVAIVVTWAKGVRYQRFLPKRDIVKSIADLEEELESIRGEWIQAQSDIRRKDELAEEKRELKEKIDQLRDEVSDLESARRERDELLARVDKLRQDAQSRQQSLDELTRRNDALRREVEAQQAEVLSTEQLDQRRTEKRQLQYELDQLKYAVTQSRSAQDALKDKLNLLEEKAAELREETRAIEARHHTLQAEVGGLEARKVGLEKQIDDLREMKVAIGGPESNQDDERATRLLWEPALRADDFGGLADPNASEERLLGAAMDRIASSGFVYHPRVIKAFHTSLKCADDAPLTVLAGISGTGKSALPTQYAQAMGIHLQTVPVQPGWDSPADLLGFYNHLEGRYRPTELMRALIQMDYVHGSDGVDPWPSGCEERASLSDRMLLVLLDEMNLARVEYYFSEFLSRLELRRGVAANEAARRRRSELVLDLGTGGSNAGREMRVFVGRNVLFVGTMNEDESTQTLSDKVIDRSNVMRFGRPNRLALDVSGGQEEGWMAPALRRETWKRWVQEGGALPDPDARRVEGWTETLNGLLSDVGRPFAYRVSEAIRSYVKHYPKDSRLAIQEAVADQVELRILPRLRGIDLHDPIAAKAVESLQRMVADELEDDVLADALYEARRPSSDQLFHWPGLDRSGSPARFGD